MTPTINSEPLQSSIRDDDLGWGFFQSSYELVSSFSTTRGFGMVEQYLLSDEKPETIAAAVQKIEEFLKKFPKFCATFPTGSKEELTLEVKTKKHLVINGYALTLSSEEAASMYIPIAYRDQFFSRAILKEPVSCTLGHHSEKIYLSFWVEKKGNVCPEGNHPIISDIGTRTLDAQYPFVVQEELQSEIEALRKEILERARVAAMLEERVTTLEKKLAELKSMLDKTLEQS